MKTYINFRPYRTQLFLEWKILQTSVVEKLETHILCSTTLFLKSCHFCDNVEKFCRMGKVTDGNMAHANCMLDKEGYKYKNR